MTPTPTRLRIDLANHMRAKLTQVVNDMVSLMQTTDITPAEGMTDIAHALVDVSAWLIIQADSDYPVREFAAFCSSTYKLRQKQALKEASEQ